MGQSKRIIVALRAGLPAFTYYYTVGAIGFWIPLYVKGLGWPYREVTLLSTIYFLALTPSTFVAGFLADALGRPGLIVTIGMLGNALTSFLMPFARSFLPLALLRAIQAVSLATSIPIALGALSTIFGTRRGISIVAVFNGVGLTLGAIIGSYLLLKFGFKPLFFSAGILSILSSLLMYSWSPPYRAIGLRAVFKGLGSIPLGVYVVAFSLALRTFFTSGVFSILSVLFRRVLGLSLLATGAALALNPLFQTMATPFISKGIVNREVYSYGLGLASTSLVFYLYVVSFGAPVSLKLFYVLLAQALLGIVYATIMISGNTYIISRSPEEIRYTASSLFSLSFNLGWIVGSAFAGAYMDVHGPLSWVRLSVVGCVFAGLLALLAAPLGRSRTLPQ